MGNALSEAPAFPEARIVPSSRLAILSLAGLSPITSSIDGFRLILTDDSPSAGKRIPPLALSG